MYLRKHQENALRKALAEFQHKQSNRQRPARARGSLGLGCWVVPVGGGRAEPRTGLLGGTQGSPSPGGTGHLPGDGDMDPRVGLAPGPHGQAGLWGAGDRPCCSIAGAGTNSPRGLKWGPGLWAGEGSPRELGRGSQVWGCPQGPDAVLQRCKITKKKSSRSFCSSN